MQESYSDSLANGYQGNEEHYAPWGYPPADLRDSIGSASDAYSARLHSGRQEDRYGFRPMDDGSPGARGRWQSPYDNPSYGQQGYTSQPPGAFSAPEWSSMPPAQRMYPSLGPEPNRQFSAR